MLIPEALAPPELPDRAEHRRAGRATAGGPISPLSPASLRHAGRRTGHPRTGPMTLAAAPRHSPLDATHRALGARLITFAGYEMPVRYTSAPRGAPGGPGPRSGCSTCPTWGKSGLRGRMVRWPSPAAPWSAIPPCSSPAEAQYSMVCAADGGIMDDLIVYRTRHRYLIVCNAANRETVVAHLLELAAARDRRRHHRRRVRCHGPHRSPGPPGRRGPGRTDRRRPRHVEELSVRPGTVGGIACLVARTGYTGEDGFELFFEAATRSVCGTRCATPVERSAWPPAGSPAGTSSGWRPACRCTGRSWGAILNPLEADLGRARQARRREISSVGRPWPEVAGVGPARRLIGLAMREGGESRATATRCWPGTPTRRGRGDQRRHLAHARQERSPWRSCARTCRPMRRALEVTIRGRTHAGPSW